MSYDNYTVIDCDGHIVESVPEMAEFMSARIRQHALKPSRNRQGVFPSLDGMHFALHEENAETKRRITASEYRPGSGEDWLAFLDRARIERTVLFTSEGLSVGFIQVPKYAVEVCRAYNDYVYQRFAKLSDRLRPMALIPMQDVPAAVQELRRAIKDLGLPGAMLPSCGLPLHLAHQTYWPVYEEAEKLGVPVALHGGANAARLLGEGGQGEVEAGEADAMALGQRPDGGDDLGGGGLDGSDQAVAGLGQGAGGGQGLDGQAGRFGRQGDGR